jgi:hypothetical protein
MADGIYSAKVAGCGSRNLYASKNSSAISPKAQARLRLTSEKLLKPFF